MSGLGDAPGTERETQREKSCITLSLQAVPHLHPPSSLKERERREKNICIYVLYYCTAVFWENIYIHNILVSKQGYSLWVYKHTRSSSFTLMAQWEDNDWVYSLVNCLFKRSETWLCIGDKLTTEHKHQMIKHVHHLHRSDKDWKTKKST